MQELNDDLYAFGDGAVVRCATTDDMKDDVIWRPDNMVLYTNQSENVTAKKYPLMYITERYILLFSASNSLTDYPLIVYDRETRKITNCITEFTIGDDKTLTKITGLQRIFHNKYAILNMRNPLTNLYAICLMDMKDPTTVIPLLTSTTKLVCTYAGYVLLKNTDHILFMLSLSGKTTTYGSNDVKDSNLYRLIYKRSTCEIVVGTMSPVLHYLQFSTKWHTVYGAIFHQINDNTLLVLTSMYYSSSIFFVSGVVSSSDFNGTNIDNETDSWIKDTEYEYIIPKNVGGIDDNTEMPNIQFIGMTDMNTYARRRVLYSLRNYGGLYSNGNCINEYSTHPFATTSIDDNNIYFMFVDSDSKATLIHVIVNPNNRQLTYMTYAPDADTSYAYTEDAFTRNDHHLLAYNQNTNEIYKTFHRTYNGSLGIYAARFTIYTNEEPTKDNKIITNEYGDYTYTGVHRYDNISPDKMANAYYIPFNGKLYAGYYQRNVTDKRFVPVVAVE
jgi:hypothetical protein